MDNTLLHTNPLFREVDRLPIAHFHDKIVDAHRANQRRLYPYLSLLGALSQDWDDT
jgi:hypothetical protein